MEVIETTSRKQIGEAIICLERQTKKGANLVFWIFIVLGFSRHFFRDNLIIFSGALSLIYVIPVAIVYGWLYSRSIRLKKSGGAYAEKISMFGLETARRLSKIIWFTYPIYVIAILFVFLHASIYAFHLR